jgi:hypothetical protein
METIIPSNLKAFGDNPVKGLLRVKPEDFLVEELFDFDLSDDGQHLWIKVEKIGQNTQWVAINRYTLQGGHSQYQLVGYQRSLRQDYSMVFYSLAHKKTIARTPQSRGC